MILRPLASFGEGVARATKALTIRFGKTGQSGWSAFSGGSRVDYTRFVGDGRGNSIVQAAVGWIARNFPEAPIEVEQKDPAGEWEVSEDPGAVRMTEMLRRPNEYWSGALMEMALITDFWIKGNAYRWKIRGGPGGAVSEIWWLPDSLVEPVGSESVYIEDYIYKPDPNTKITIPAKDVIHHRWGIDPANPRKGLSPLGSVLREIFTDEEAANFSATILRNLGVPGLVVIPKGDIQVEDEDAEAVKRKLDQRFGGDNRGSTAVLSTEVSVQVLSWNPQQLQLKDLRRVPEERITAVLGVAAIVAGLGAGLDRSTFANFAEARQASYEENIIPTQRLFRADLDHGLLPDFVGDPSRFRTAHDLSEVRVLQEDQNALATRAAGLFTSGVATLADARRLAGLPVEDHHNYFLRGFSLSAVIDEAPQEIPEATGPAATPPPTGGPVALPEAPGSPQAVASSSISLHETVTGPRSVLRPRQTIVDAGSKALERDLRIHFRGMLKRSGWKAKGLDPEDYVDEIDWQEESAQMSRILKRSYNSIGMETWDVVNQQLGSKVISWDLNSRGVSSILDRVGTRVTMITEASKDAIRSVVRTGISIDANADKIERDLQDLLRSWGESGSRAHIIALTESANAFNVSATTGYAESGLVEEVEVFDGDDCGWTEHDDPDLADGSTRPIMEADAYPIAHPHCQRAFGPVVATAASRNGHQKGRVEETILIGGVL